MKVLVFSDNSEAAVVKERGKYFITEDSKFRKNNPYIIAVKNVKADKGSKNAEKKESEV